MPPEYTEFEDALQVRAEDLAPPSRAKAVLADLDASPFNRTPQPNGSAWTIPLLCLGLGIIAMALIVPATDENRRLVFEREKLAADLAHVQKQIAVNDEFLARLSSDPGLAERLAQRQMNMVREGTSVLELPGRDGSPEMSPFELVTIAPPAAMIEYRPVGGKISGLFHHPKVRLYLLGAGMLVMVLGVVLGSQRGPKPAADW